MKSVPFPVYAEKRGYLLPERIKISTTWPLGLFRAWSYIQVQQPCVVYPKPGGTLNLPPMSLLDEEEALTGKGSGTEDFVGFRQYQSGDSMRAVDWKAYARERGLVSKRFSGKGTKKILLDLHFTSFMGDLERGLSQLCQWVLQADQQALRYSLQLPGMETGSFSCGDAHRQQCLEALASYGQEDA